MAHRRDHPVPPPTVHLHRRTPPPPGRLVVTIHPVWPTVSLGLGGLALLIVGVAFVVAGSLALDEMTPAADGVATEATVVEHVRGSAVVDGIARVTWAPVYEFVDVDGQRHRAADGVGSLNRPPAIGSTVEVSYVPGDPTSARRTDVGLDWLRWFTATGAAMASLGSLLLVAAGVRSLRARRRRPGDPTVVTLP